MPLSLKIETDKDLELAVWKVTEDHTYFRNKLSIHEQEKSILETLSHRKLVEWLSSRYLLHVMSGRSVRGEFTKDIHGKPHLENSTFHISISHSKNRVAVLASPLLVGIDIQHYVSKIHRIRHKFVNDEELALISDDNILHALHVLWGAKESLYKAYGKRKLDFKKNIQIKGLELTSNTGTFYGKVIKDVYEKDFILKYHLFKNFTLVYAKEHI